MLRPEVNNDQDGSFKIYLPNISSQRSNTSGEPNDQHRHTNKQQVFLLLLTWFRNSDTVEKVIEGVLSVSMKEITLAALF